MDPRAEGCEGVEATVAAAPATHVGKIKLKPAPEGEPKQQRADLSDSRYTLRGDRLNEKDYRKREAVKSTSADKAGALLRDISVGEVEGFDPRHLEGIAPEHQQQLLKSLQRHEKVVAGAKKSLAGKIPKEINCTDRIVHKIPKNSKGRFPIGPKFIPAKFKNQITIK